MREFIVGSNDAGQRLDKFLTKAVPSLPQALLYKYIRLKRIKVNGKRSEIRYKLALGDKLSLYINDEFFERPTSLAPSGGELSIVYEDENLLIADKPAGLLCHEGREAGEDTLISRIQAYLIQTGAYRPEEEHSFAPALCHRIDRGTSGLVIAAKTAEALRVLCEKIKLHEIQKTYLCIAVGEFQRKSGRIKNYLYKNEAQNRVYAHDRMIPGARTAETHYKVLDCRDGLSLVQVTLITGRTHQIRVHMAGLGHPLLGDSKYGIEKLNRQYRARSQLLQAYRLQFRFSGESPLDYLNGREITSPTPLGFQQLHRPK